MNASSSYAVVEKNVRSLPLPLTALTAESAGSAAALGDKDVRLGDSEAEFNAAECPPSGRAALLVVLDVWCCQEGRSSSSDASRKMRFGSSESSADRAVSSHKLVFVVRT